MPSKIGCADLQTTMTLDRRSFVKAGILGASGLSLAQLLQAEAQASQTEQATRRPSVIILWMRGGPSQHDMWDPKPDAPVEIRGEFKPICTNVPGVQLTELQPMTAKMMSLRRFFELAIWLIP